MENRGFVERTESGAGGRRTRIGLTAKGRSVVQSAIRTHAGNIRRYFLDSLTDEQTAAIRAWSERVINQIEQPVGDGPAWFAAGS
jgi:DNA-binding MarR family transcriptional regulator